MSCKFIAVGTNITFSIYRETLIILLDLEKRAKKCIYYFEKLILNFIFPIRILEYFDT